MNEKIPDRWSLCPLKDICYFQEGPGLRNWQYKKTGIKFLNIRCIKDGKVDLSVAQSVAKEEVNNKYKHFLLDANDYVLSSSGTLGRLAKIDASNLPLLLNTSIIRFRSSNENVLDHLFLRYFLQSKYFFDKISEQSQGSAQANVGPTHLKLLNVVLPTLPEQKKIASILNSVDEIIEKTQSQINRLQDLKKGTMNELLTRGIGHIEFKDSELGKIPKGWEISDLKSLVVSHNSGIYKKKSEYGNGYNILGVSDLYSCHIVDGQIFRKVPLTDEEVLEFSLKKGDLVYGESSLVREGIAKTVCVSENGEGTIFAWHTRRFSVSDNMDSIFLNYFLSSNISRTYLTKVATQTALTGITTKDYFGVKVVIPSFKEQQQIVTILSSIDNHIEKKQRKLQKNQYLKKSLMQDLLTGKVRVSVN